MGEKGMMAILAGNQRAPNLQNRVARAKEALKKYPNMKLNDPAVFSHLETRGKRQRRFNRSSMPILESMAGR
jgi:hypothetical protein